MQEQEINVTHRKTDVPISLLEDLTGLDKKIINGCTLKSDIRGVRVINLNGLFAPACKG